MKTYLRALALVLLSLTVFLAVPVSAKAEGEDYIKWVDCNVSEEVLKKVADLDIKYHGKATQFHLPEVLAYLAVKNGNRFSAKKDLDNLAKLVTRLESGETVADIYGDNKYYRYHLGCFEAIFSQYLGEYVEEGSTEVKYGLTAYFPLAKGYWYNHYDDFGNSRSFGYKRRHLGHDIMGGVGTPVVAVEGGRVAELGWNRYGGWRIGIRSHDTKRYYYYAHLRKDRPFAAGLSAGDTVSAGQVIGYLGRTGYSDKENVNLQSGAPHLHFGLQLIFDESQVKGNKEIWVDVYAITRYLARNRAAVVKDPETKEYASANLRRRVDGPAAPDNAPAPEPAKEAE